jgi:hypothetical protein
MTQRTRGFFDFSVLLKVDDKSHTGSLGHNRVDPGHVVRDTAIDGWEADGSASGKYLSSILVGLKPI